MSEGTNFPFQPAFTTEPLPAFSLPIAQPYCTGHIVISYGSGNGEGFLHRDGSISFQSDKAFFFFFSCAYSVAMKMIGSKAIDHLCSIRKLGVLESESVGKACLISSLKGGVQRKKRSLSSTNGIHKCDRETAGGPCAGRSQEM